MKDFWSSNKKLAWVEFEPTTTEFRSDPLTEWAIRPWVQVTLTASFSELLLFHLFVQCSRVISVIVFVSRQICFKQNLAKVITLVVEWIDTYGIHQWRIFEIVIESWHEWVWTQDHWTSFRGSMGLSYQAMSSTGTQGQLCTATPIWSLCLVFTFHLGHCLCQSLYLL